MNFNIKDCTITIDFSFILILSFSALFSAREVIFLMLFSSLHELGHFVTLMLCRGKPKSLTFSFYGFGLKYCDNIPRLRELLIIISGPLVNFILWLIIRDDINLLLFILNVLPIYPLDGGRVIRLFSYKLSTILSAVFIIIISFLSVWLILFYNSFSLLFISVYLIFYSICY